MAADAGSLSGQLTAAASLGGYAILPKMNVRERLRSCCFAISTILFTTACLLLMTGGSLCAEETSQTASSDDASSSGTGLESALQQDWGTYKVQWGDNQYRGKETTEQTEAVTESTDVAAADSQETKLAREPPRTLRSGASDAGASNDSLLRSLEGELPKATSNQNASDSSVNPSTDSSTP